MAKHHCNRKNSSRKKGKSISYSDSFSLEPCLVSSFIGKKGTLDLLLQGYKASLHFNISENKKEVILKVTSKHRNYVDTIITKLVERYNKIVIITNNLIESGQSKEE